MQITPLGDNALQMVEMGDTINESTHRRVQAAWRALAAEPLPGVSELVAPGLYVGDALLRSRGRQCRPARRHGRSIVDWLTGRRWPRAAEGSAEDREPHLPRTVEIPVCYGGDFGPDLARVAAQAKLSPEEVIKRHSKATYLVYLIGFAPGFPYLGGLPKELATPRHAKPRMAVPAGSVGIAGEQTGIYPQVTPGGWNLIGATPQRLFRPEDRSCRCCCAARADEVEIPAPSRRENLRVELKEANLPPRQNPSEAPIPTNAPKVRSPAFFHFRVWSFPWCLGRSTFVFPLRTTERGGMMR